MAELAALLVAVQQNNDALEEIEGELANFRGEIEKLPEKFIPRTEADAKAHTIKKWAVAGVITFTSAFLIGGVLWYDNHRDAKRLTQNCSENRETLKQVIEIAVADRQPLTSSTPETILAIEENNRRVVRPLRERLLSLEGTQPEKC